MQITQKARVELGEHQIAATGVISGNKPADYGSSLTCSCGEYLTFMHIDLQDDESDATPYLYGLMASHQIQMMEEA